MDELLRIATATAFRVEAYCVMPDHLHTLLGGDSPASALATFVHRFKQSTGFKFKQRTGHQLFQRSYHDHVLRPDESAAVHAAYIIGNPVRAGLVDRPEAWPYSGPRELFSETGEADRSEDLSLRVQALVVERAMVASPQADRSKDLSLRGADSPERQRLTHSLDEEQHHA